MASPLFTDPDSCASLPSSIDGSLAVKAFRNQRNLMLNRIHHCLPSLANSLHAKGIIPRDTLEFACNETRRSSERGVALLDCVAAGIEVLPSNFTKIITILEQEPYLEELAENLACIYSKMCNEPKSNNIEITLSSPAITNYRKYLRSVYKRPISPKSKWPPTPSKKYINLAVVQSETCRDDYIGYTIQGNIKELLNKRKAILIEEILEPDKDLDQLQIVLVEGAPGIGKSTLAWELCRKWEELSCMRRYSLVILLRLREKEVQSITEVSELFRCCSKKQKMCLEENVLDSLGDNVLLILDGFDELPNKLQSEGFLIDLISGDVLPSSTILITSRPSATAELLLNCCPQKRIEILGFTQESVEDYAASVLSDPETLEKFKDFISASDNPAINSLMYIPLNAAIILEIYQNCKSDSLLPRTLTELYTQLCLTYINRYLTSDNKTKVTQFDKLPSGLHEHFLELSKKAFEGVERHQVTFHTMNPSLVHFGLLDAVPALYGGGQVSYNFLHLTLQEFLAAYHISQLREGGLKILKQYGNNTQWRVVWRFVAGLTKLKHYGLIFDYAGELSSKVVSVFYLQCLYEANSVKYIHIASDNTVKVVVYMNTWLHTPLDFYILGYCMSNLPTGLNWVVSIESVDEHNASISSKFLCGLKTNKHCANNLMEMKLFGIEHVDTFFLELKQCFLVTLVHLKLHHCLHTNTDMIKLTEIFPCMPKLEELDISNNELSIALKAGLLQLLHQISKSSVKALNLCSSGLSKHLQSPSSELCLALKSLICLSSGKLEKIKIDNSEYFGGYARLDGNPKFLLEILSAPSTLKHITLETWLGSLPELENSKNVTSLAVQLCETNSIDSLVKKVEKNTVLQDLTIEFHRWDDPSAYVKILVDAIRRNRILKVVRINILLRKERALRIGVYDSRITLSAFTFSIINTK